VKNSLFLSVFSFLLFIISSCDDSGGKATVTCGNDRVDQGEACDGNELGAATCESLGYRQGQLACTATCEFDLSDCASWGRCGDGILQDAVEQCDRFQLGFATCGSLGYHDGELACDEDCTYDTSGCEDAGICGDGILQSEFEACDTTVPGTFTCESAGRWSGNPSCTDTCEIDFSTCAGFCGDGEFNAEFEDCDPLVPVTTTCAELGTWYGEVGCTSGCGFDTTACREVEAIDLGPNSVYAIDSAGTAFGWGGSDGGVGQPVLQHYATPMPITIWPGLTFIDIATMDMHSCALDGNRNAWCWGTNASGQLGDGTTTLSYEPVAVRMPNSVYFTSITVGYDHSCGLGMDGTAFCWGAGSSGQLGTGGTGSSSQPNMVSMPSGGVKFTKFATGFQYNCAIGTDEQVYCWGRNDSGQLGLGNTTNRTTPMPVVLPGVSFTDVACGSASTCAVSTTGAVYCWGRNDTYQLGLGDNTIRLLPALRTEPAGIAMSTVAVGAGHGCSVSTTGRLWCWGFNNSGQVGDGTTSTVTTPLEISMPGNRLVQGLAAGTYATCVRLEPGQLACWGFNSQGQFGTTDLKVLSPVLVAGP